MAEYFIIDRVLQHKSLSAVTRGSLMPSPQIMNEAYRQRFFLAVNKQPMKKDPNIIISLTHLAQKVLEDQMFQPCFGLWTGHFEGKKIDAESPPTLRQIEKNLDRHKLSFSNVTIIQPNYWSIFHLLLIRTITIQCSRQIHFKIIFGNRTWALDGNMAPWQSEWFILPPFTSGFTITLLGGSG